MCDYKDKCHLHTDTISEASLLQHTLGFQTQNETEWSQISCDWMILTKDLKNLCLTFTFANRAVCCFLTTNSEK